MKTIRNIKTVFYYYVVIIIIIIIKISDASPSGKNRTFTKL